MDYTRSTEFTVRQRTHNIEVSDIGCGGRGPFMLVVQYRRGGNDERRHGLYTRLSDVQQLCGNVIKVVFPELIERIPHDLHIATANSISTFIPRRPMEYTRITTPECGKCSFDPCTLTSSSQHEFISAVCTIRGNATYKPAPRGIYGGYGHSIVEVSVTGVDMEMETILSDDCKSACTECTGLCVERMVKNHDALVPHNTQTHQS